MGHFGRKLQVGGTSSTNICWYQKTSVWVPKSEDCMILVILSSFVWVQYQHVTDGQTDGRTELSWLLRA